MSHSPWFVIGISGAPSGNKKKLASFLFGILPRTTTRLIMQESYFHDLGLIHEYAMVAALPDFYVSMMNLELIYSVNYHAMYQRIARMLKQEYYLGKQRPVLILEGFRLYDDLRVRDLVDLPLFVDLDNQSIVLRRRAAREQDDYIEACLLPEFALYRNRCISTMPKLKILNGRNSLDIICDEAKALLITEAKIEYPLMDFRPKRNIQSVQNGNGDSNDSLQLENLFQNVD